MPGLLLSIVLVAQGLDPAAAEEPEPWNMERLEPIDEGVDALEELRPRRVTFSGQIRLRGIARSGPQPARYHSSEAEPPPTLGALMQVRMGIAWRPYDGLAFVIQGRDAHAFGQGLSPAQAPISDEVNLFDLETAYLELHTTFGEAPMRLRLGRQSLSFGRGALVDSQPWLNVPLMWDAARVTIGTPEGWMVDLWGAWSVVRDPTGFDGHAPSGDRYADSALHGLYATGHDVVPGADLDVAVMVRHAPDHGDKVLTVGARWSWSSWLMFGDAEIAGQVGSFGGSDHLAGFMKTSLGVDLNDLYDLKLQAGVTLASGEANDDDRIHRTFDAPYGRADWGPLRLFGHQNILAVTGKAEMQPWDRLTVHMALATFFLPASGDAWYNAHAEEVRHAEGRHVDPYLGTLLTVGAHLPWDGWLDVQAGASYLFSGGYVRDTGRNEDAAMAYLQISAQI